jgi:hypothetical protein
MVYVALDIVQNDQLLHNNISLYLNKNTALTIGCMQPARPLEAFEFEIQWFSTFFLVSDTFFKKKIFNTKYCV